MFDMKHLNRLKKLDEHALAHHARGRDHDAGHTSWNSHPSLRIRDYDSGAPISDISGSQSGNFCRRFQGMVASSGRRHSTNWPSRHCKHNGGLKLPSPMVKEAIVKRHSRIAERPQVELVREALGAIAARLPAVFWLYIDCDGRWSVRREGALNEEKFGTHEAAFEFLELEAARCSSYRLFVQRSDGRISEESFNWITTA